MYFRHAVRLKNLSEETTANLFEIKDTKPKRAKRRKEAVCLPIYPESLSSINFLSLGTEIWSLLVSCSQNVAGREVVVDTDQN